MGGELNSEIIILVGDGGVFPSPAQNTLHSLEDSRVKLGTVRVALSDDTSRDRGSRLLMLTIRK